MSEAFSEAEPGCSSLGPGNDEGLVKPFLEHLEDLRWVLIKCLAALVICMATCLVGANHIAAVLIHPLKLAQRSITFTGSDSSAAGLQLEIGGQFMTLESSPEQLASLGFSVPRGWVQPVRFLPDRVGSRVVVTLQAIGEPELPQARVPALEQRGPMTPFFIALKTGLVGGLGLAFPWLFFFVASFVVPALKVHEKRFLGRAAAFGAVLFIAGASLAYFVIARMTLSASLLFSKWLGLSTSIWFIDDYAGFLLRLILGVGLAFELPVVLLTLVRMGVLDYPKLKSFRPYWIVVNLAVSALLTPQDITSQVMLAVPLHLLFEVSLLIAWIWHRRAAASS